MKLITDENGLEVDYRAFAERLAIEFEAETGKEVADFLHAAKADLDAVKWKYELYKREKARTTVTLPGEDSDEERAKTEIFDVK